MELENMSIYFKNWAVRGADIKLEHVASDVSLWRQQVRRRRTELTFLENTKCNNSSKSLSLGNN